MKVFRPKTLDLFKDYSGRKFVSDIVAGVIVAIIALPLSVALAIASGVPPEKGLYTAITAGFIIALFGGSNVNVSGPTAAFATIVAGIVAQFGTSGLIIATVMAGVILIVMGLCRFGSLIKYIPYTITTGFTAGIAVTIAIGQVKDFLGLSFPAGTAPIETLDKAKTVIASIGTVNWQALIVGAVAMAVLIFWPKISRQIPGSLIAVIVGVLMVKLLKMNVNTIGDLYSISRSLPVFALPEFSLETVRQLVPSAFTIAVLAGIESLLSCVVSDGMINDRHNSNTELIAQGLGNICSGLFGGIPATGAIARTAANVKNGGRSPVSGMTHAAVLLFISAVLMPYAAWIPMPVIAAILFMVAYNMCGWRQMVHICKHSPKSDILVLLVTFVLTVVFDLVVAIEIGMIAAAVLFIRRMAEVTHVREWAPAGAGSDRFLEVPEKTAVYDIDGPMFFAAADKFSGLHPQEGLCVLILRMKNVPAMDTSAARALEAIYSDCEKSGVSLVLSHVNEQPMNVIRKSGLYEKLGAGAFPANIDEALRLAKKITKDRS